METDFTRCVLFFMINTVRYKAVAGAQIIIAHFAIKVLLCRTRSSAADYNNNIIIILIGIQHDTARVTFIRRDQFE